MLKFETKFEMHWNDKLFGSQSFYPSSMRKFWIDVFSFQICNLLLRKNRPNITL